MEFLDGRLMSRMNKTVPSVYDDLAGMEDVELPGSFPFAAEEVDDHVEACNTADMQQECSPTPSAGFKKMARGRKGPDARVGPPRDFGAVETALRNSSDRTTEHIFEPVVSTAFDSIAEAYDFYNLSSWEVGFGIRYGSNRTNSDGYRTSQDLVCQLEGYDKREKNDSPRCGCKSMIRLHRSDDHGWFVVCHRAEHNHHLSDNCGEKMQWNSPQEN